MNGTDFEEVFERQVTQSRDTLVEKAKEYADDVDRLHNFKVAAAFEGCTEEQALWGMATKHFVSISDAVRLDSIKPVAWWDEKIGDALNYLILLRAQVFESDGERSEVDITLSERLRHLSLVEDAFKPDISPSEEH